MAWVVNWTNHSGGKKTGNEHQSYWLLPNSLRLL